MRAVQAQEWALAAERVLSLEWALARAQVRVRAVQAREWALAPVSARASAQARAVQA